MIDWLLLGATIAVGALVIEALKAQLRRRKHMAQQETLTGIVALANDTGIKLDGEDTWRNYTKQRSLTRAAKGDHVQLTVAGDWINNIEIIGLDAGPGDNTPAPAAPARIDREATMLRCSALKQAVAMAQGRGEVSSDDVLKVAGKFLAWLQAD